MRTVPPTQNNYLVAPGTTWTESSAFVIRKYFPDNIRSRREQVRGLFGNGVRNIVCDSANRWNAFAVGRGQTGTKCTDGEWLCFWRLLTQ